MTDPAMAALKELVRLKRLKDALDVIDPWRPFDIRLARAYKAMRAAAPQAKEDS
jgi:hypothetical protein